jgi:two-component system LytT family sensor kinase
MKSILNNRNYLKFSLVASLLLTLMLNFFRTVSMFVEHDYPSDMMRSIELLKENIVLDIALHLVSTFLLGMILFYSLYLLRKSNLFWRIIIVAVICFSLSFGLFSLHLWWLSIPELGKPLFGIYMFRSTLLYAAVFVIVLTVELSEQRRSAEAEAQRLIAENMKAQFEVLKNQVNPHFLFNSLSTLNSLIPGENTKAYEYIQKLSSVLRYTLQNKDLVSLEEELNFAQAYAYLMHIRYGDALRIKFEIDENLLKDQLVPLGVQALIENAIKHNVITRNRSLDILVKTTDNDTVVVENALQPKLEPETGHGLGLANLTERYRLLSGKEIVISNDLNSFKVEIPLLKTSFV